MDLKHRRVLVSILLLCCGLGWAMAADCSLKDYVRCSNLMDDLDRDTACSQLDGVISCLAGVMAACGMPTNQSLPVCEETKHKMACHLLVPGLFSGPMSWLFMGRDDDCSVYRRLTYCHSTECGPSGDRFQTNLTEVPGSDPARYSCPKEATSRCLSTVLDVSDVTPRTCREVGEAKTCFLENLYACTGTGQAQFRVDLLAAGLGRHVMLCKEQGYNFTTDGGLCAPNPVDAIVSVEDYQAVRSPPPGPVTEDYCSLINAAAERLNKYLTTCHPSGWNQQTVHEELVHFKRPLELCKLAGFIGSGAGPLSGSFLLTAVALCLPNLIWFGW